MYRFYWKTVGETATIIAQIILFLVGMLTIPSHGWFMTLFNPN